MHGLLPAFLSKIISIVVRNLETWNLTGLRLTSKVSAWRQAAARAQAAIVAL